MMDKTGAGRVRPADIRLPLLETYLYAAKDLFHQESNGIVIAMLLSYEW